MEVEHLLDEFPAVTTDEWERVIHQDLKGADYVKKLIWHSPEGIEVKPYYRREDLVGLARDEATKSSSRLGVERTGAGWRIREEIDAVDLEQANRDAQLAVASGAEEISFRHAVVSNASDLNLLLVNLETVPVHFRRGTASLLRLLCDRMCGKTSSQLISIGIDPLDDPDLAAATIREPSKQLVHFTICVEHLEAEGASTVHELAFALAAGIEYLADMNALNVATDQAAKAVAFSFSIGASYFFQIAKFRAFRELWSQAVASFGGSGESARTRINTRTSTWNKTVFDPHVNVLRATTEAMSAVLGGVDSVCVAPFDECYKVPDTESRRLARNTQLLLKHEALLTHVADPGGGSYYLESLTRSIGQQAWKLMQRIESAGGYRKAAASGLLDSILEESRKNRDNAVVTRRRVFTGTNQYADRKDKALDRIDTARVEAVLRGTLPYEQLRLRTERFAAETGRTPRVLLAEFGEIKMRAARSNFALNFFACAGFEIAVERFESADAIEPTGADLIVLCSADAEYLEAGTTLMAKLRSVGCATPVIVAGNPETSEQLRVAGISDFINNRSSPIEVLTRWQQRLGMRI